MRYLKTFFIIILFGWISFFPQPIHDRYSIYVKLFLAVLLFVLMLNKKYLKHLFGFQDLPLWLFLICLASGTISATNKDIAFNTYFYLAINFIFLFYIGKELFLFEKDREMVSLVICICSGIVAFFGILETIFAFNPIYVYFVDNPYYERYISGCVRPMSTQFNPAPLATYLLVTLPFIIYIFKQKGLFKQILGFIGIVLNIACFLLTFCRSSFLGLVIMLFFYQLVKKRYKLLFVSILVVIVFSSAAFFLPYPFNRISPQGIGIYGTGIFSEYRISRLQMAWQMLKDKPLFGVGLNHFRTSFDRYYPAKAQIQYIDYEIKIADNMHLTLMAEIGLIGMMGFWIFVLFLLRKGLRYFVKLGEDRNKKSILLATMSALVGSLVSASGYELFYWANPYMLFCLICGFIQGLTYDS